MKTEFATMKNIFTSLVILAGIFITFTAGAQIQYSNEFWISTNATGNFPASGTGGTLDSPYDGSTAANFDSCMNYLCNAHPNSTIHILTGIYDTKGDGAWGISMSNIRIVGSGIDRTVLKIKDDSTIPQCFVIATCCGSNFTNDEVSDLTVDGNYTTGNYNRFGIDLGGTHHVIRRVKAINLAENASNTNGPINSEGWGIGIDNYYLPSSEGNVIEDCEVSNYKGGIQGQAGLDAIFLNGNNISGTIRNNRIYGNGDPNNPVVGIIGGGLVNTLIEGNYFVGVAPGLYAENPGITNLIFAHNRLVNCEQAVTLTIGNRANLTFNFNNIVLTNFDGHGWIVGFLFIDSYPNGNPVSTNVTFFGNTVSLAANSSYGEFLELNKITGLNVAYNTTDSRLTSAFNNCANINIDKNYDFAGNYLSTLNVPTVGSTPATSLGLSLIGSAGASPALTALGLPSNPLVLVTNNATGLTLSGTLSGNGSGLTSLNASQLSSGAVPLTQLPSAVVTNNATGVTFGNMNLNGSLAINNLETVETNLTLSIYTGTDYWFTADSAAYVALNENYRRLFIGAPSQPIARLNMENVQLGESFPSFSVNNNNPLSGYLTPTNNNDWAFVSSRQGIDYFALIANSAGGFLTGQISTDANTGHRSLAFKTFSDTNDVYHLTAQYVFDTAKTPDAWFTNQAYWSWRIDGVEKAKIDTNASWYLTAPTFSVSGNIAGGTFTGNGSGLTNLNASQITSGNIPLTQLPSTVVTNNATGLTLSGTFSGDGSGLTGITAQQVGAAATNQLPQNFISALYPISGSSSQIMNTNHGLAGIPQIVRFVLVCQTNDSGYVVGDEVNVPSFDAGQYPAFSGGANSTGVFLSQNGNAFVVENKTTGTRVNATTARWKAKAYATYFP